MNNKIKELKDLLWEFDSRHSVSVPDTQENINNTAERIVKLFVIPDVSNLVCQHQKRQFIPELNKDLCLSCGTLI